MTDIRKWAFVGLMSLGAASIGCASNNNSSGTGGSNGSGGSSSGKGGSTGSGGSSTGSGGSSTGSGGSSTGSGGAAGATVGCAMSDAPASAEIATFSAADGGIAAMFGTFTYGDTPPPSFTVSGGMVNVTDNVVQSSKAHYQGFGIYFNGNAAGTDCLDASTYTGIQFDLSGSLTGGTGCAMVFSINDAEHGVAGGTDPKPSGPAGSYAPQLAIQSSQITSTKMTIMVPFTGAGSPAYSNGAASPATAVDPTKLTGVQWQMAVQAAAADAAGECDWNINISNVKFY